ncbi:ABC transporter permease [Pseudobacteriovorax antillogorgiicola]|uniref:Transport permease protein n=1 Tax=Pseudobacteriovorax antillogorgiicola TaxID=1513793 RepID=A0A1Y6CL91_9BACT|nr:ABC transporter permease [Pseudobacteriovorax antillogorgiicola]TCS45238.1 ABC-2 type transport system permease protein/lipopolysaccharide transport system permease protein [Pseudobacteriovorax antillogorgiicola]SMF75304.1 ABC-2 type transport system permease protein/lipopolysaccharide transport system permease protein [Pseudobacteriovorax antillogorgiicola]
MIGKKLAISSSINYKLRKIRIARSLIVQLIKRDLRLRYRGSLLGYFWSMLNPLLYMAVLSAVFSYIIRFEVKNYSLFLLTGILIWNFFQQSLSIGVNSILFNGSLLKKVKVPASLFPFASVSSVLINFLLSLVPFAAISIAIKGNLPLTILFLPLCIGIFATFIFGVSLTLASLNVRFRDIGHLLDPILTILFYSTPIIYPKSAIPEKFRMILDLNPLTYYLDITRDVMFTGVVPEIEALLTATAFSMLSIVVGYLTFNKLKDEFVYDI